MDGKQDMSPYDLRPRKNTPHYQTDDHSDSELSSDSDYDPDGDSNMSDGDEEIDFAELGRGYRVGISIPQRVKQHALHLSSSAPTASILGDFTIEEKEYLHRLPDQERIKVLELDKTIRNTLSKEIVPLRFRILKTSMDEFTKRIVLTKLNQFTQMTDTSTGEYFKLKNWLERVSMLPFDKYIPLPISSKDPLDKINHFMSNMKETLDKTVYGHHEAKMQILRILAQWISNPVSYGHCIGIQGSMGVGKTSLIKNGLAKALNIPFGFIALGGASDASFLEGHMYTYEGSTYGKIAEMLIRTQCSNPILFFDELDKVSSTKKGEEITGILTHLTDPTQNEKFNDKYFGEIDLNLSRCLVIFSYNNDSLINPILKDRLITIHVEGYKKPEKKIIAQRYLLPELFKTYSFMEGDVYIGEEVIELVIELVAEEDGVRNLKRGLDCMLGWINMKRYTEGLVFPYTVTCDFVHKYLKKKDDMNPSVRAMFL